MEYSCKECSAPFVSLGEFEEHMKVHVGEYVCDKCKRTFKRMDLLVYHQCKATGNANKVDVFTCSVCGKVFDNAKVIYYCLYVLICKLRLHDNCLLSIILSEAKTMLTIMILFD